MNECYDAQSGGQAHLWHNVSRSELEDHRLPGCPFGELYDIERDPNEFANLWDDSAHSNVKLQYLKESFDATVSATDTGPPLRQPDATRRP